MNQNKTETNDFTYSFTSCNSDDSERYYLENKCLYRSSDDKKSLIPIHIVYYLCVADKKYNRTKVLESRYIHRIFAELEMVMGL
jgi:hypothetical protein